MEINFTLVRWLFLLLAAALIVAKYAWCAAFFRRKGIIVRSRIFRFYSQQEISGTSQSKRHYMVQSNWLTVAIWMVILLCLLFWMLGLVKTW